MFIVKTPEEVFSLLSEEFQETTPAETIPLEDACGRILAEDVTAGEYVPGFHRSTVDGYAVSASDTFGCSDSIPAILLQTGEVRMGESPAEGLSPGCCMAVPTGGALPEGADAVVMVEYTEDYRDGSIGILKPVSPGSNLIYRGDDVFPGKKVLQQGRKLTPADIGALAAMGISRVPVHRRPVAGILSTGDELVPVDQVPGPGQIRDVNSLLLSALCREMGAEPRCYGILGDDAALLSGTLERALEECDLVLVSGGSSVGAKDVTARVIEDHGRLLLHGIAMKPGKPTILGKAVGKAVFGLPGHPVAAFLVSWLFVRAVLASMTGRELHIHTCLALLSEAVSANHGRSETIGVRLRGSGDTRFAEPIHTKSGLISALAGSDGTITISRDCEGLPAGAPVEVTLYSLD